MIKQTAYSNMPDIDKEIIYLKDTDTNDIGDHIIPYNPRTIKNITLNGEITCTDTSAEWYCAGGGIYFELTDELGNSKLIHKEYKFNQGYILRITLIFHSRPRSAHPLNARWTVQGCRRGCWKSLRHLPHRRDVPGLPGSYFREPPAPL